MARGTRRSLKEVTERRMLDPRLPTKGYATIKGQRGRFIAEAVDISASGVCMSLPKPLEVGGMYQLELEVQGEVKRAACVVGRVCFCLQGKDGYRIGFHCNLVGLLD